jgi:hypothetical protein
MKSAWLLIAIPVIVVVFFVLSWLIQISWNNSVAQYLQLQELTFHQSCWLNTLSFLLFRNIPISSGK